MQARLQIGDGHIIVLRDWIRWADSARRGWSWQGDTLVREFRFRGHLDLEQPRPELRVAAKVNAVIDELGVGGEGLRPR